MPWEKSFDTDRAIDRATEVFWAKGYEATSLTDLLTAMGINKGSFYNAFGSKKKLFTESLLKYDREQRIEFFGGLSAMNDPVAAITELFNEIVSQSQTDKEKKGCFLVNTALDLPNHDKATNTSVIKGFEEVVIFFKEQIKQGQSSGVIPAGKDLQVTANGLFALLVGLRVLSRGGYNREGLNAIRSQAIDLIS